MEKELRLRVENFLQNLLSLSPLKSQETTFILSVADIGSWLIKVRQTRIIYNRREIVYQDNSGVDSEIYFKTFGSFLNVFQKSSTLQQEATEGQLIYKSINPNRDSLAILSSLVNPSKSSPPTLSISIPSSINSNDVNSKSAASSSATDSSSSFPLLTGNLLKRRDYISGWKLRYFEIFSDGRLDYYNDAKSRQLRGSMSLSDGKVGYLKQIYIRRGEVWSFSLEIKGKIYRLASQKPGLDGKTDSLMWLTVIEKVINSAKSPSIFSEKSASLGELIISQASSILPSSPLTSPISSLVSLPESLPPEKRLSLRIFFSFLLLIIFLVSIIHYLYRIKKCISQEIYLFLVGLTTFLFGLSLNTNLYQKDKESVQVKKKTENEDAFEQLTLEKERKMDFKNINENTSTTVATSLTSSSTPIGNIRRRTYSSI